MFYLCRCIFNNISELWIDAQTLLLPLAPSPHHIHDKTGEKLSNVFWLGLLGYYKHHNIFPLRARKKILYSTYPQFKENSAV